MSRPPLVLLGFGYVARYVLSEIGAGREVWATSRAEEGLAVLREGGVRALWAEPSGRTLSALPQGAHVVVSFPPDGHTDAAWAAHLPRPAALVYVSSTGVYPLNAGMLDDATPAAPDTERGERRLAAETTWRAVGAVVLRAPAIYGPERGVLERLRAGTHRLTGGGGGRVSRIHVEDLATCIGAALERGKAGAVHVVGDRLPTTQREIVEHICRIEGLPLPPSVQACDAAATLRGDRAVSSAGALQALGVSLRYPTYREGLAPLLRPPSRE